MVVGIRDGAGMAHAHNRRKLPKNYNLHENCNRTVLDTSICNIITTQKLILQQNNFTDLLHTHWDLLAHAVLEERSPRTVAAVVAFQGTMYEQAMGFDQPAVLVESCSCDCYQGTNAPPLSVPLET